MKREPKILIQDNTIFLTLDLKGLDLYQRGKAIRKFINSDTKIVEDYADTLIRNILKKHNIFISSQNKVDIEKALIELHHYGKKIDIIDFYKDTKLDNCEIIETTKRGMTIMLEDNRHLNVGIEIKECDSNV